MKVNPNDFKHLPQGKQFVEVLEKMFALKEGESPYALHQQLLQLISHTISKDSIPYTLPYLVALAIESRDFSFVNLLGNVKLGFYHRGDVDKLSPTQLRQYLAGLHNIRQKLPLTKIENTDTMDKDFKSLYVWNSIILYSFSNQILPLSKCGRFTTPFKVECLHCRNDIHSLYIDGENPENTKSITPAPKPQPWNGLFCDDLYPLMATACDHLNEEYFAKILPYVFGTYRCTVCEKENRVIDAMARYQPENAPPPFTPTVEFLRRLELLMLNLEVPGEKWEFAKFIVAQYRNIQGLHSPEALFTILQAITNVGKGFAPDMQEMLLAHAMEELQYVPEDFPEWEKIYCYLGMCHELMEKYPQAQEYLEKSVAFSLEHHGEGDSKTLRCQEVMAMYLSRQVAEIPEEPLLEHYQRLLKDPKKNEIMLRIFRFTLVRCYDQQEKYKEALEIQEEILSQAQDSTNYGQCLMMTAALQEKLGEYEKGKENFLVSIEILGKPFNLAPDWKKLPSKKTMPPQNALKSLRFYAACLKGLSACQLGLGEHKEALKTVEKAIDFWQWGNMPKEKALVDIYVLAGNCAKAMGRDKQCNEFMNKSLEVLQEIEKNKAK